MLLKLRPIDYLAKAAAQSTFSATDDAGLKTSLLVHAGGGLVILLAILVLAIYKPAGMTRYGLRRLSLGSGGMLVSNAVPKWVKVLTVAALVLTLLFALMLFHGGHGPGAYMHANHSGAAKGATV